MTTIIPSLFSPETRTLVAVKREIVQRVGIIVFYYTEGNFISLQCRIVAGLVRILDFEFLRIYYNTYMYNIKYKYFRDSKRGKLNATG